MSTEPEYTFACPECAESISMSAPMRDALVENGCVVCGASVAPAVFSSVVDG